jgi:phage gp46-like protein
MLQLDPSTHDFLVGADGDFVPVDNALAEACLNRLLVERGSCFWDPDFGSTLHELRRGLLTATFAEDLEDRVRDALAPLSAAGELTALAFEHAQGPGQWQVAVTVTDASATPVTLQLWLPITL